MKLLRYLLICFCFAAASLSISAQETGVYRALFTSDDLALTVEILDDDLAHFELGPAPGEDGPIWTSPMVAKTDYTGPSSLEFPTEYEIATPEMRLSIDPESLCVTVYDTTYAPELTLTTLCPRLNDDGVNGLTFTQEGTTDLYGLGEQFRRRGGTDGNWIGERRLMPNVYGNGLMSYNGGNVGSAQFPVLYALGEDMENYGLFVDHVYQQYWAFNADPFVMQTSNAPIRWYVMTGDSLQDLRSDYMELTGRPPVPPRQMFGLWVSEYGYENWDELTGVLDSLRAADFPQDGFVLDLQWFGGISAPSQMGSLTWDEENFPDPDGFIAQLREDYGLGIMTIEESYVSETAEGYDDFLANEAFVRRCDHCPTVELSAWWGFGSMVDWSNPDGSAWWHDTHRQPLVDAGVIGHWTDLGEPETYSEGGFYYGLPGTDRHDHASLHNLYNLMWSQSIWEGYARNEVEQRPFSLSRSGTSGSQRFGVAMWSGDIAANMISHAEHMNVQMQMSLSGVDYFDSDIGGFFRQAFDPVLGMETMYSVWLANAALLDVPMRPHAANLQNAYNTAPSLIGDVPSNLANVRLRYEISPYLYTLAHRAYRTGEAVFPPPVYHFQTDPATRGMGSQKMIGDQMMMATLTDYDPEITTVYLPEGGWFNYHTGEYTQSTGQTIDVAPSVEGLIQAPLFVRDGAIIPVMPVDDQTLNMLGQRVDGSINDTQIFNLYHAEEDGTFTLIEDDGQTMAYQDGQVRETVINLRSDEETVTVEVSAAAGTFDGASDERSIELHLNSPDTETGTVSLNGEALPQMTSTDDERGWLKLESGVILVKSGAVPVSEALTFTFEPMEASVSAEETSVRPLLLAHYMPWYQTPDYSGSWGWHWTMNHFNPRQTNDEGYPEIASQFMPLTGPYDSHDPAILEYQVLLMALSGIDGVIVDWYGSADYNDYANINTATEDLFDVVSRAGLKFAICYEDRTILAMYNDGAVTVESAIAQGQADMNFAREHWISSDAYVTQAGQPLVFVFGPIYFRQANDWTALFEGFDPVPGLVTLDNNLSFVAVAGYPWPPMSFSGGLELFPAVLENYLDQFYRNARRKDLIVGSAFPGFHDIYEEAGERSSYGYLDARDGQTLRDTLTRALEAEAQIIQLVTWNDYGEGTMIEPTQEYGYQYLEIVQETRQGLDSDFQLSPDDLRLPMQLLEARHAHKNDDEINAQLDQVFDAIVAGQLDTARDILTSIAK